MKRFGLAIVALLFAVVYSSVPVASAGEATRPSGDIPQIIVFDNEDFLGDHTHIFGNMQDLGKWGNSISSIIVLSGTWEFFDDEEFKGTKMGNLGPGMYKDVTEKGLKNNSISSIRLSSPAAGGTR
ncbi:MAG TPA: beta/gamma crystallin-related protein [Candidatus Tectomicrobia bacterium]|jgi:Beta/Gamma crystallin|nr:beta/gamma crystallin-related protein [Candidatus Tectomicrobia bacterium]